MRAGLGVEFFKFFVIHLFFKFYYFYKVLLSFYSTFNKVSVVVTLILLKYVGLGGRIWKFSGVQAFASCSPCDSSVIVFNLCLTKDTEVEKPFSKVRMLLCTAFHIFELS